MDNQHLVYGNQTEPEGQIGSAVNLEYIVRNIQNELQDYSMNKYKYLMQLLIDGIRQLRLYSQSATQVGYFKLNEAGIIKFPPDYLDYIMIGIPVHGRFVTLTVNNNILLNRAQKCAEDIRVMEKNNGLAFDNIYDGYYFSPHYSGNYYIGGLYGVGGGFNTAYFRIDKTARQIEFDGIIKQICGGQMVVMEYQSTGISAGTIVGAECIDPLKKYVHMMRQEYDDRVGVSTKERRERQLDSAIKTLRAFNQKFTISELKDGMYRELKQSPKPIT